jgi:hypothetical protein
MNPPFVRPTGHEGRKIGVPVPMFAAFSSTEEEQYMMSKAMKRLTRGTSYHGNAGEASAFLVIADRKLKMGSTVALVMPLSLMMGEAWEASREVLAKNYAGIILVSIAGAKDEDMSFSADTDMGECLFVGHKQKGGSKRGTFVILNERPKSTLVGSTIATQIHRAVRDKKLRAIEDGPIGGTPLFFGDDVVGYALDAPLPDDGGPWNLARIADLSLAQAAHQIIHGTVWLPAMQKKETVKLPMTTIDAVSTIGPYHADINFKNANGTIRGPFDIRDAKPGAVPTYPVLWSHDADRERTMCFEGESEAQHKKGKNREERELIDLKAAAVWATASHCHFNQNFRFNSQSTAIQFTPRKTIGGRAWTSIALASEDQEKALVLWGNTTLGVLVHWYHSNKQQSGRGNITPTALGSLAVWDVTALTSTQLQKAVKLFDETCLKPLRPIYEMDKDLVRKELDEKFCRDILGLSAPTLAHGGALDVLRMKLSKEPSIRGNK